MKQLREDIGWTRRHLARLLGCSENTLRQMEQDKQATPDEIARWLWQLARYHERHPPPVNWRRR
jgi:transcriptional regulator with XRE-family HTH domain